ncbi:MAG TPA: NAD(P)/FAD-dependent oxidoreductase [Chloroflexia bacterium]|nr:NAD(P)/FAD-dependent oxidoreductase [Chloroflexia bacterium]
MNPSTSGNRKALIIGCGIAGPALALFLQRAGIAPEIYEARDAPDDYAGAFLQVASNGLDVLATLGLARQMTAGGFTCPRIVLYSGTGKQLGVVPNGARTGHGATSVVVTRGALQGVLREEALRCGIPIHFGKKLEAVREDGSSEVVATFTDGSQARGNFVVGADGIHSCVRRLILPDAPAPHYTGLIGYGGFTHSTAVAPTPGEQRMIFGKRAFFGYLVRESGAVWWFSNVPAAREPARGDAAAFVPEARRRQLVALHCDDPAFVAAVIQSTAAIGEFPIYDLAPLPTWHRGPVVLVGDAAHATSPHAGQGASLGLEDAVVLAQCLRDIPGRDAAFAAYERLRKPRVEKLVAGARRTGNSKAISHPVGIFLRDLLMPVFVRLFSRSAQLEWIHSYHVDWNARVA